METIKIKRDDGIVTVAKADYIVAKTKQLIEFGYPDLAKSHVSDQLKLILSGKTRLDEGLTVIGKFMLDDIVLNTPAEPSPAPKKRGRKKKS